MLKKLISSTRAARTHVLALALVLVAHYVPGHIAQAVIPAVALVLGLPVADTQAAEKAAEAVVTGDVATVKADAVAAVDAAESAVVSPRSDVPSA